MYRLWSLCLSVVWSVVLKECLCTWEKKRVGTVATGQNKHITGSWNTKEALAVCYTHPNCLTVEGREQVVPITSPR